MILTLSRSSSSDFRATVTRPINAATEVWRLDVDACDDHDLPAPTMSLYYASIDACESFLVEHGIAVRHRERSV